MTIHKIKIKAKKQTKNSSINNKHEITITFSKNIKKPKNQPESVKVNISLPQTTQKEFDFKCKKENKGK